MTSHDSQTKAQIRPDNTLIIVALESELPADLLPGWRVVYSGVGKVNAAITCAREVISRGPELVINYGTAGSLNPEVSGLVEVSRLYERDMDVRPLGFEIGQTPFEDGVAIDLGVAGVSCGTGDSFVTSRPDLETDIVDMEAYALAKCAQRLGCAFRSFKYISDQADEGAVDDWQENQRRGAALFVNHLLRERSGAAEADDSPQ